ncbi:MAG: hypothetical protein HQ518_22900 [Rhodopirellula sp.]|nr:hypothetical protein [Rhodopirellula sp.]
MRISNRITITSIKQCTLDGDGRQESRSRHCRTSTLNHSDFEAVHRAVDHRNGSILTLSAAVLVMVLAFTSFTVDIGWITLTLAQMHNACDAAALAGATELGQGTGLASAFNAEEIQSLSTYAASSIAAENAAGGLDSTYIDAAQDVRLGQYQWLADEQRWAEVWGAKPYTLIEVAVHRDRGSALDINGNVLDGPLPLFFAPVIGQFDAGLGVVAAAAIMPGGGFRISSESSLRSNILPIALDEVSWNNMLDGVGGDDYEFNAELNQVAESPDGILEVNIYPTGSSALPPGNRGTVDIGSPNNSTSDLKRQILEGINADDMAWFGGELRFDGTPLELNGDTGVSAGIESSLKEVIGQVKAIPLFTSVSGPGNNATYVISRFVGVRVMAVRLTGNPNKRQVTVQPAPYSDATVVKGRTEIRSDSIFTTPALIR